MSQQQLGYATPVGPVRRPFSHRVAIATAILVASVVATPIAVAAAWASAGAGHGTYFWFLVLYPVPIWSAKLAGHNLSGFVETLMYAELPAYGLLLGLSCLLGRRWFITSAAVLAALHAVGVALEYIIGV